MLGLVFLNNQEAAPWKHQILPFYGKALLLERGGDVLKQGLFLGISGGHSRMKSCELARIARHSYWTANLTI